jgi:hypothetical protein
MAVDISAGHAMSTYTAVGMAEDVSDIISNITPTETPYLSSLGSYPVKSRSPEWQEDDIRNGAANAKVEGAEYAVSTRTPTVMRMNYTQIMSDAIMIPATVDVVDKYGRAKESAYQLVKTGKALKRDLEYALIGVAQNATVGSSTVARVMGNILGNAVGGTAMMLQSQAVNSTVAGTGDGTAAFVEDDVMAAMFKAYTQGVTPKVLMVPPKYAMTFAGWASAAGKYVNKRDISDEKKITMVIEILVTPYGTVKVVLNRNMVAQTGLLYDPEYHKLATLRGWKKEPLAKTGDNEKWGLVGEFTFIHKNFNEGVKLTGLPA